jgi:hypothetical protein
MANNWKDGELGINYFNLVNGTFSEMNDSFNDDIELLFTDKESLFTTTFTDKPTLKNTVFTDKPTLKNVTYDDKGVNA